MHIPDCVVFNVTLNACRGFCESYAIPSPSRTLRVNDKHVITSRAECCSIRETHDVSKQADSHTCVDIFILPPLLYVAENCLPCVLEVYTAVAVYTRGTLYLIRQLPCIPFKVTSLVYVIGAFLNYEPLLENE